MSISLKQAYQLGKIVANNMISDKGKDFSTGMAFYQKLAHKIKQSILQEEINRGQEKFFSTSEEIAKQRISSVASKKLSKTYGG